MTRASWLVLIALFAATQSGCFYLTHNVRRIGREYETLDRAHELRVAVDGSVALACDRVRWRETYGRHGWYFRRWRPEARVVLGTHHAYLISDGPVPLAALREALRTRRPLPSRIVWRREPGPFAAADPTTAVLPIELRQAVPEPIALVDHWPLTTAEDTRRTPGGMFAQVLLLPAFAIDLVTLPIQFFITLELDPPPL